MADSTSINIDPELWTARAKKWRGESEDVRARFAVTDTDTDSARRMFGPIGSKVGGAFAEALEARSRAGARMANNAEGTGTKIEKSVGIYVANEEESTRILRS